MYTIHFSCELWPIARHNVFRSELFLEMYSSYYKRYECVGVNANFLNNPSSANVATARAKQIASEYNLFGKRLTSLELEEIVVAGNLWRSRLFQIDNFGSSDSLSANQKSFHDESNLW